jgi:hypothetical protein
MNLPPVKSLNQVPPALKNSSDPPHFNPPHGYQDKVNITAAE